MPFEVLGRVPIPGGAWVWRKLSPGFLKCGSPYRTACREDEKGHQHLCFFTTPMYDVKVQLLQPFQLSCQLTLRLSEVAQPGEESMICTEQKSLARQIGAVLLREVTMANSSRRVSQYRLSCFVGRRLL